MDTSEYRQNRFIEITNNELGISTDQNSRGMCIHFDARIPSAGGNHFLWFPDENLFFELARLLSYAYVSPNIDNETAWVETNRIIDQLESGKMDLLDAQIEMNNALEHIVQIDWWGTLGELISSKDEFPSNIRAGFWESRNASEEEVTYPIPEERLEEFADWIFTYPDDV
jgi:hypothetical protein